MNNYIEKQLTALPRAKLSMTAKFRFFIRLSIHSLIKLIDNMRKVYITIPIALAVIGLIAGMTSYAYNSVAVTHGTVLFTLKSGVESVRVQLAATGTEKVNTYLDLSNRRMAEAKYLAASEQFKQVTPLSLVSVAHAADEIEENLAISETLEDAVHLIEAAMTTSSEINTPEELQKALELIEKTQKLQTVDLKEIATMIDLTNDEASRVVSQALVKIQTNLEAIQGAISEVKAVVGKDEDEVEVEITTESEIEDEAKFTKEEIEAEFAKYKADKAVFLASLAAQPQNKHTKRLEQKLNDWEQKIMNSIAAEKYEQAHGLIKAAYALQKNAKYFTVNSDDDNEKEKIKKDLEKQRRDIDDEDEDGDEVKIDEDSDDDEDEIDEDEDEDEDDGDASEDRNDDDRDDEDSRD